MLKNVVASALADYAEAESIYELSLLEAQTDYDTQKISASYASSIRNTSSSSVANNVTSLQVQLEQKQANAASLQEKLAAAQAKQKINQLDMEETYQETVITGQNAQTTYNATVEDLKETLQEAEETKEKEKNSCRRLRILSEVTVSCMRGMTHEEAEEKCRNTIKLLGLDHRIGHKPNELSGGQKQRVSIARALVGQPAILLADEPTGALDQTSGKEVLKLFRELNDMGNTIVMITHDLGVAQSAKRIVRIVDGQLYE